VVLADRDVFFEPLVYSVLFEEGEWDAQQAVATICAGQVGLVVVDFPLEQVGANYGQFGAWPAPVLSALEKVMRLESNQAHRNVYVPRTDGGGC
jgi:hypothetical protein